jgi:hypothetical protein
MLSSIYYLLRAKRDGRYVAAMIEGQDPSTKGYLLTFQEHHEALSYVNTHSAEVAEQFGVESVSATQLKGILQRWGFGGIGLVKDPLIPQIQFLSL